MLSYRAKYLGGYSAFPGSISVTLNLKSKHLEIPELGLQIPYKELITVRNVSSAEVVRFFFIGGYGSVRKKERPLLMLTFKDGAGIEQCPIFDVENIQEAQPIIYQRMLKAKGVKTASIKMTHKKCGTCAFFRKPALCPTRETNPNATPCVWYRKQRTTI